MLNTVDILSGSTFVTSDRRGDIEGSPETPHGLFAYDTRFLSLWRMTLDGQSLAVLSTDDQRYYCAQFFLAPSTGTTYIDSPMSVLRRRWIENAMWEKVEIFNHTPEPRDVHLRIDFGADFADLFEVKDALEKKGELYSKVEGNKITLGYARDEFRRETHIVVEGEGAEMTDKSIDFTIHLDGHSSWTSGFRVEPTTDLPIRRADDNSLDRLSERAATFRASAPRLQSDWRPLERAYERSIEDLGALRLQLPNAPGEAMIPAAGLPWFMSLFGRDSLIASYQAIPFLPDLALATLRTLASMQGKHIDNFRDEEPGKIPHELRFGELTAFEERPHSPYYGSADSTTLWLVLLDEYARWTGREDVVRELEQPARAALEWIDRFGDRDGDGYIEYERHNPTGLENQCWKDSWDSIRFSDGRMPTTPRATCELQGYAYDAKVRSARLAREIWGDLALAERLESEAAALKDRFNRDFWLEERGYFALALDGEKSKVDALTSNIGHLLWSGIVDDDKAAHCVRHLTSDRMFSGWGIRTMALGEGAYNPIGYHVGTVWPHDNSIIAAGLWRYGYREEASRLTEAMIEASTYFDARLPEAFAGYPREYTLYPAEYPTACSPQAWASGTPLLMIRVILGLQPEDAQLLVDPYLPEKVGQLSVAGIPGRWGRMDVSADAADTLVDALEAVSREAPPAVRELFAAIDRADLPATKAGSSAHASVGFRVGDAGDWLIAVDDGHVRVREGFDTADCVLEASEPVLVAILRGEQNARTAIMSGKVKVTGDIEIAQKLGKLVR